jgi:hypothetical protein
VSCFGLKPYTSGAQVRLAVAWATLLQFSHCSKMNWSSLLRTKMSPWSLNIIFTVFCVEGGTNCDVCPFCLNSLLWTKSRMLFSHEWTLWSVKGGPLPMGHIPFLLWSRFLQQNVGIFKPLYDKWLTGSFGDETSVDGGWSLRVRFEAEFRVNMALTPPPPETGLFIYLSTVPVSTVKNQNLI